MSDQATRLPCFGVLLEKLGRSAVTDVEVVMLHQLFQVHGNWQRLPLPESCRILLGC